MGFIYVHGETPIVVAKSKDPQLAILEGFDLIKIMTLDHESPNTVWLNAKILPGLQYRLTLDHALKEYCGIKLIDRTDLSEGIFILFNSEVSTVEHPQSALVLMVPTFMGELTDGETLSEIHQLFGVDKSSQS